jgi:hypothetical protein
MSRVVILDAWALHVLLHACMRIVCERPVHGCWLVWFSEHVHGPNPERSCRAVLPCCVPSSPQARHRGGPRLSVADVCRPCLQRLLQGVVASEDLVYLRESLLAALEADEKQQPARLEDPTSLYVSKTWWHGFKRRCDYPATTSFKTVLEPPTAGECVSFLGGAGPGTECVYVLGGYRAVGVAWVAVQVPARLLWWLRCNRAAW